MKAKERCYLDHETRSTISGRPIYEYAKHPTTDIICTAYKKGDIAGVCVNFKNSKERDALIEMALDDNVVFVAHYAVFEWYIWNEVLVPRYGFPHLPLTKFECTMIKARYCGLLAGLDAVSQILNLENKKDPKGKALIAELSVPIPINHRPHKGKIFWSYKDKPESFEMMYEYCLQDVRVCEDIDKALPDMIPVELDTWRLDTVINQYGIQIDLPLVEYAVALADENKTNIQREFEEATDLEVRAPSQRDRFKKWLAHQGVQVLNTKRATLEKVDAAPHVMKVIKLVNEFNRSSVAKFNAFKMHTDEYGILRDMYVYGGAHTLRWSSVKVQVHNMARCIVDCWLAVDAIKSFDLPVMKVLYKDVNVALSSAIRGCIIARDNTKLFCADFAQMEARVLAWLAGEDDVLQLFRDSVDTYCKAASTIFSKPIDKDENPDERQVGKVSELALGYQGGIGAYATMATGYGVDLSGMAALIMATARPVEREKAAESYQLYLKRREKVKKEKDKEPVSQFVGMACDVVKQRWRKNRPRVVKYWADMEAAAIQAVLTGKPVKCGKGTWFMHGKFLVRKLASGRPMFYPFPKVETSKRGKHKISYRRRDPETGKWVRHSTYGGQLVENEVQALQRDLLRDAMLRLHEEGYTIVLHTHDESVVEVPLDADIEDFIEVFKKPAKWSGDYESGLPIDVDAWEGRRYKK